MIEERATPAAGPVAGPSGPPPGRRRCLLLLLALVVLRPVLTPAAPVRAYSYAALGDSYTSGPSLIQPGETSCLRTNANYPSLVAAVLRAGAFRDASCISARLRDVAAAQGVGPANPPQEDVLGPSTTLVTLSLGANDVRLADVLASCLAVSPTPCRDRWTAPGPAQITVQMAAAQRWARTVLADVRRRAPNAAVFVIGYPHIVPASGTACGALGPLPASNLPFALSVVQGLNAMLREVAQAQGDAFVDTESASAGHDACQPPGTRWVEPLASAPGLTPLHPNPAGADAVARVVISAIRQHQ